MIDFVSLTLLTAMIIATGSIIILLRNSSVVFLDFDWEDEEERHL